MAAFAQHTELITNLRRRRRRARALVAAVLLSVLALAGCSADSDGTELSEPAAPGFAGEGGGQAVPQAEDADRAAGEPQAPDGQLAPVEERSLIYSGSITVEVESVVQAADEAIALATGIGGYVAGDNRTILEDSSQATLVLRVPADRFTSTLDSLARLGDEQSRLVQAEDVTEQLVDLDARIATQQASLDRVRDLLARAQTIGEIVSLENELTQRQAELDSLLQRRETMSGLVALATITVVLHGPSGPEATDDEPETGFLAGLRAGWKGFLASVKVVLTVAGWLLPWAIAIGGPVWLVLWIARRRHRSRRAPTPPPAMPPTMPPAPPA